MKIRWKKIDLRKVVSRAGAIWFACGVLIAGLAAVASAQQCPAEMEYVPGGYTAVVYDGQRWGGRVVDDVWVDDFCIDRYEASQPDATDVFDGSWNPGQPIPSAESKAGVLPWIVISWTEAGQACAAAGKRLPTLAEWQTAYSGYEGWDWPWGSNDYDEDQAAGCYINEPYYMILPTGGCCFTNCQGDQCFSPCDMVGNVAEWVDELWDERCFGDSEVDVANAGIIQWFSANSQVAIFVKPDCWTFKTFALRRFGLHNHPRDGARFNDDGFRCAKSLVDDDTIDDDTVDDDTTPGDDDTVDDDTTPTDDDTTPPDDDTTPPDDDTTPPDDDSTPGDDDAAPADDDFTPDDDTAPDDDVDDDTTPDDDDDMTPSDDDTTPDDDTAPDDDATPLGGDDDNTGCGC